MGRPEDTHTTTCTTQSAPHEYELRRDAQHWYSCDGWYHHRHDRSAPRPRAKRRVPFPRRRRRVPRKTEGDLRSPTGRPGEDHGVLAQGLRPIPSRVRLARLPKRASIRGRGRRSSSTRTSRRGFQRRTRSLRNLRTACARSSSTRGTP
mgnify:CR=1 FL=1|jgi:hypothetical protein